MSHTIIYILKTGVLLLHNIVIHIMYYAYIRHSRPLFALFRIHRFFYLPTHYNVCITVFYLPLDKRVKS